MNRKKKIAILVLFILFGHKTTENTSIRNVSFGSIVSLKIIDKIELLNLHNDYRGSMTQLEMNISLDEAAQSHADWMAANNTLSHNGANGSKPWDRIQNKEWHTVGENIALGQTTASEVFNDWIHSSGHRANIVNSHFSYVGFGIAYDKNDNIYWVTVFSD